MTTDVSDSPEMPASVAGSWWCPFTHTGDVSVVHVDLTPCPAHEAEAYAWLNEAERASWPNFMPGPRRRFSLSRAALRAILCGLLDCTNEQLSFGASGHGKPFALIQGAASAVSFNVSHSGNHGLIALSATRRLGVDVEERVPKRSLALLIEEVMGRDEQAELASLPGTERLHRFYRLWTFKESLIKALGTGFSTDPSQFQIPPRMRWGEATGTFRFPHLPSIAWSLADIGDERFAAALAYELPQGRQAGEKEDLAD